MKKKLILTLLTALVITGCSQGNPDSGDLFGAGGPIEPISVESKNLTYQILNEYDEEAPLVSKENTFAININDLVNLDNHQYYYSLAKLSFLLAEEAYPWATIQKKTSDSYTKTEMLKEMNMMDYMSIVLDPSEYTEDVDDIIAFNIGYSYLKTNNKNYNIVVVSFRGTYDDVEWNSNFDIGASEVSAYSEKEKHSEWINKKNHKGFDVASNRAITEMNNYLSNKLQDDAEKNIYLFTGHSRGGAVANIVAKNIQSANENNKVFAYTFASPRTTEIVEGGDVDDYIYNIINTDDVISAFPTSGFGFTRYGVTKSMSTADCLDEYHKILENKEYKYTDVSAVEDIFDSVFPNRTATYTIPDKALEDDHASYDSLDEALAKRNEFEAKLNSKGLYDYFSVSPVYEVKGESSSTYCFEWEVAPVAILGLINDIQKNRDAGLYGILSVLLEYNEIMPSYITSILGSAVTLLTGGLDAFKDPHMPESYLTLVNAIM